MRIRSNKIVFEDHMEPGIIEINNGIISDILPIDDSFDIDYSNQIIAPGLIDIHNHGYAGWSFTNTSLKTDLQLLLKRLISEGVTSMLATSARSGFPQIVDLIEHPTMDTEIIGIHTEGPFLNPQQYGAAPPGTVFETLSISLTKQLYEQSNKHLKMMTLAPEMPGNLEVIDWLNEHNIKVAVGHTNATYDELIKIEDKISNLTHLGNAMSGIHHREIGAFGFGLKENTFVELIADGLHVSKPMMELIFQIKDPSKIILISDTVPLAGLKTGNYQTTMGEIYINKDGLIMNEYGQISGSSRTLLQDLQYLFHEFSFELPRLFQMASLNPAHFLNLKDRGSISVGKKADLLVLDDQLQLDTVYKNGSIRYQRTDKKVDNQEQVIHLIKDMEFFNYYCL